MEARVSFYKQTLFKIKFENLGKYADISDVTNLGRVVTAINDNRPDDCPVDMFVMLVDEPWFYELNDPSQIPVTQLCDGVEYVVRPAA